MNHSFNITIAQRYGIEEAILIEHIYWWIHKNECDEVEDMVHEGAVWCRSTAKGFAKYIPYMKPDKIWRILKKLEGNILRVGNFNRQALNQTLWYTFTDDFINEMIELNYDFEKIKNAILKNEKSNNSNINIPINENIIKEDKKRLSNDNQKADGDEDFNSFYKLYPLKKGKLCAERAWKKLSAKDKHEAIDKLPAYIADCVTNKRSFKYPATYLNQRTWEDDFCTRQKISFYDPLDSDSDEKKRFKEWMRNNHPEIENTALPLSYEDYIELVGKNYERVYLVNAILDDIDREIWKYRKSDIATVIRQEVRKEEADD